jgi:hypothetical protein
MIILAIESSCDDTCVAILKDKELLSNVVSSQTEFHNKYGGVMPELASRLHVEKISFVIKEALSKVFCCCCKIKVIENKDKIFAESGKEIEKQLDTKTVASFAQKSKIMNHLLLKKNAVMLTYMLRQNISYDTLYQIRQDLIQHKIINSATPFKLAYYKQNFFVNALTTMRNQGDLNKTDLLLIDLMKLNPDLICQFFISNFDKLELIYPEKFPKGEKEKGDNNY